MTQQARIAKGHFTRWMTPGFALSNVLAAVADKTVRRDDVAVAYADLILFRSPGGAEYGVANRAILTRWKPSGLNRIKGLAWKRIKPIIPAGKE